ncbi:MAG: hypothetical protein HKN03_07965 [Acidimicrobiales bacterium]|nr:hypothetical protein [Acidimicrobiales bacterium]
MANLTETHRQRSDQDKAVLQRLVVLETNEIPLRIFRWYAANHPESAIAELLSSGAVTESIIHDEVGEKELYPSQTWATLATGVPLEKHKVYWYADPKPDEFPLYWELAAAANRTVGVVGTLHSSPIGSKSALPGLRFCVPDVFAATAETIPSRLERLQSFSLDMANANSRAVTSRRPVAQYLRGLGAALAAGVRPTTFARLGRLAGLVAIGRVPAERLRTAHSILMADVFERLLNEHDPDLSVFFTNHVAAAMHRYWFAAFPEDWDDEIYDHEWRARFGGEIDAAMAELDRLVDRLAQRCALSDRSLLIVSSMGQTGGEPLRDKSPEVFVVRDAHKFLQKLGFGEPFQVRAAMVPQISAALPSAGAALIQVDRLEAMHGEGSGLTFDVSGHVVTVTYELTVNDGLVDFAEAAAHPAELGGEIVAVSEHRNGMHHRLGSIIASGTASTEFPDRAIDVLELAPAILEYLGVEPAAYHRTPSLSI